MDCLSWFFFKYINDLSKYNKIIPCGIKDKGITSLKNIGVSNYAIILMKLSLINF